MTDNDRLQARGRMAYLHDDIRSRSRERDNLLRPLRERLHRALPPGVADSELANLFDCAAAQDELAAVARAETALAEAVDEYNRLAAGLGLPGLKQWAWDEFGAEWDDRGGLWNKKDAAIALNEVMASAYRNPKKAMDALCQLETPVEISHLRDAVIVHIALLCRPERKSRCDAAPSI